MLRREGAHPAFRQALQHTGVAGVVEHVSAQPAHVVLALVPDGEQEKTQAGNLAVEGSGLQSIGLVAPCLYDRIGRPVSLDRIGRPVSLGWF